MINADDLDDITACTERTYDCCDTLKGLIEIVCICGPFCAFPN